MLLLIWCHVLPALGLVGVQPFQDRGDAGVVAPGASVIAPVTVSRCVPGKARPGLSGRGGGTPPSSDSVPEECASCSDPSS